MDLFLSHLAYPLPVAAYEPPDHPFGEAIRIIRPTADPKSLGLMPGMEGDLILGDGTIRRVRLGATWTVDDVGSELRIPVQSCAD